MKGNSTVNTSNYNRIAQRAYDIWERNGRPDGRETEHWLQAESEIRREDQQRGGRQSAPSEKGSNGERGGRRVFTM
jgi:hypothetical protein